MTAPPRPLRALEATAGLLAAGVLVLGVVLLAGKLIAPGVLGGIGIDRATGPLWWRLVLMLLVGAVGETVFRLREKFPVPGRAVLAAGGVLCCVAVLWLTWWQ